MVLGWVIAAVLFTAAMTIEPIRDFLFGDLDEFEDDPQEGRSVTVSKRGSLEHIPIIYGQRRTGGILNFKGVEGTVKNENLWQEFILSEGECDSLVDVYLDGVSYTDPKYSGLVGIWFYNGTDAQTADSNLVAKFADYNSNDRGRGLCKCVVQLVFNDENMTREPKIEFEIKGKKIFDTRTSTTAFSDNPALVLYDYLTNSRYGAGYKISASQLSTANFNAMANFCETQTIEHTGTSNTIDYYEFNGVVDTGESVRDNIIKILNSFHAHLVPDGSNYQLIIEKDDASVLSLTHDNIIEQSINYAFNDIQDRFNEVVVSFPNKEKKYLDDQVIISNATLLAQDNNIKSQKRVKQYFDTNYYRMVHFVNILLKKSRQGIAVGLTVNEEGAILLPGDIVTVSLVEAGWTNKKFRVLRTKDLQGGNVGLNLLEHEPSVYDRTLPVEAPTPPDTYLPDPYTVDQVAGLTAASGETHVILASSGDFIARIYLTWTPIDNIYITHYEIQAKLNASSDWINQTPAIGKDADRQYVVGFDESDTVDIRVRAVNARGVAGAWSPTLNHIVAGTTSAPPDVTTFTVLTQTDGTRQAQWTLLSPPIDLDGFKLRYSSNLSATWETMTDLNEGLVPFSPYEFNLLNEGDWLFAIKAVDRGGRESANAKFSSVTLPAARLGTILLTESPRGQGWPGTKTGCYVESSDNSLIANSTDTWADLTSAWSTYTSDRWHFSTGTSLSYEHSVIDLGVKLVFSVNVSTTVPFSGTVLVEEAHSDDNITYTSFAIVAGPVNARYIKIKVTVTNASDTPKLENMSIVLGGDSIVDTFTLLDTSTLTVESGGGIKLPIRSEFKAFTDVNLALHSVGSGASWEVVSFSDIANGPHIRMYNSSGTQIYPTISAQVIGV